VDFLVVLIDLFSLAVTAEAIRLKKNIENKLKIGVLQGVGQYPPNFHVEGDVPRQLFLHG